MDHHDLKGQYDSPSGFNKEIQRLAVKQNKTVRCHQAARRPPRARRHATAVASACVDQRLLRLAHRGR